MAVKSCRNINDLPRDCIAYVISLTTPKDACRLSVVNSTFWLAAESDAVWERFLPSDYRNIISCSVDRFHFCVRSKKDLYLHLSNLFIVIDSGNQSFKLEKWSGKKCFMLVAGRGLHIPGGRAGTYQRRFLGSEIQLHRLLEIRGFINIKMLTWNTNYAAYLVFMTGYEKQEETIIYINFPPDACVGIKACVGMKGHEMEKRSVFLNVPDGAFQDVADCRHRLPKRRMDRWMEVELGEYFVKGGEDEILEICLSELQGLSWRRHQIMIRGIEIRPKE